MKTTRLSLLLAPFLAVALASAPAEAQGNGRGKQQERARQELRERDRDDDDRWDDRRDRTQDEWYRDRNGRLVRRDGRKVPPGWCRGRGNPHNTPENCGYSRNGRRYDDRYDRDRDRRYDDRYSRDRRYDNSRLGSYDQRHRAFHASHDRQCREQSLRNPTNLRYQIQVRTQCKARHDEWHRQMGIRHR
ncbi:MAG TPA: hypothetical protein VHG91_19315 [Longimicrobium sp.]|nr:hypothetical protein [Longimicrobium sp.]